MELTVQNVYGLLLRSKLLSPDEAKAMFARWQHEAKDAAGNLPHFASWMSANKYLTEYQAQLLARGHADGFFLNEYKILERLGKGRMAGVYKAQHHLGQIVAIKVLPPSKAKEANFVGRFQREARLALLLKHPNIVRTFQTGTSDGLHYIVMEHLEGETLEEVLARRGKLPPAEAVRLIYQTLQGLQHIHTHGLVHRDLKPANMMLIGASPDSTLRATVKLLDIGLGRALFDETAGDVDLTSEGVLLGTPDYMSPEQGRDARSIDIRADIYSLGCVLYHLLAGQPPFPDTNIISQMIRHATETPKPIKAFNSAVSEGLQQIVNWMMAKDASQRYPTPERAAGALQVFLVSGNEPLAVPEADPRMKPYLTWLEDTAIGSPSTADRQPEKAKSQQPTKLPAKTSTSEKRKSESGKRKDKPLKKKPHPPQADGPPRDSKRTPGASAPQEAAEPVAPIDVELLPLDSPANKASPIWGLRLSRREMVVFGVGALLGAVVTAIGALLAFKHRE